MKEVERRVDEILHIIGLYNSLHLEDEEIRVLYGHVDTSKIENFRNYPYEYQYFLQKIGWLKFCPGYEGLSVFPSPVNLKDLNSIHDDEKTWLYYELECERTDTIAEWARKNDITDHILVAEDPCSYVYLAFNPNSRPYTAIEIWGDVYDSFLDMVEGQLENIYQEAGFYKK